MGFKIPATLNAPVEPSGDHDGDSSRGLASGNYTYDAQGDLSMLSLGSESPWSIRIPHREVNCPVLPHPPSIIRNFPARFGIDHGIISNADNISVQHLASPLTEALLPQTVSSQPPGNLVQFLGANDLQPYGWPISFVNTSALAPAMLPAPVGNTLFPSPQLPPQIPHGDYRVPEYSQCYFHNWPGGIPINHSQQGNQFFSVRARGMSRPNIGSNRNQAPSAWGFPTAYNAHPFPGVGHSYASMEPQFQIPADINAAVGSLSTEQAPTIAGTSPLHPGVVHPIATVGPSLRSPVGPPHAFHPLHTATAPFGHGPRPQLSRGRSIPPTRYGNRPQPASPSLKRPATGNHLAAPVPQIRKTKPVPNQKYYRPTGFRVPSPPHHIKWEGPDESLKLSGNNCFLCKRDLSAEPEGPFKVADKAPCVAVLPCKHTFHDHCLKLITPEDEIRDPPCLPCATGEN